MENEYCYFWVRIYDFKLEDNEKEKLPSIYDDTKGTLLDEYYISGKSLTREKAKEIVKNKSNVNRFAKPKKANGLYAIVMDSSKSYADYFCKRLNTKCLCCHKPIQGLLRGYPVEVIDGKEYYFCSYDCKAKYQVAIGDKYGEWQNREGFSKTDNIGYIYHIYNRAKDMHYIGQSLYMPFFRWQEHVKSKLKGDICDLIFEVITEVPYNHAINENENKKILNDVEAWWINKFIKDYGNEKVMNITKPQLKASDFIQKWERVIDGNIDLITYKDMVIVDNEGVEDKT